GNKEDYTKESGKHLEYDVKEAQKAWKAGLKELGVNEITVEFTSDDTENARKSSEFIQDQLQKNLDGLTVKLKNLPIKGPLQNDQKPEYEFTISVWGACLVNQTY
ncbi:peptide ABC transporter substrate-binding protein, partial [Enterococcus faecium]